MANILYRGSSIPGAVNSNTGANRALTNLEIDQNFYSLNRDKFETAGGIVSGPTSFSSTVTINGDLTVNGTTTTINATTLTVDDKNIELGAVASPTNSTAEGGGITLLGATNKTFNWYNSVLGFPAWASSEHIALPAGRNILLGGSSSGVATLAVPAAAGNPTITFQTVTGTVAHLADIGNGTITVNTSTGLTGSGSFTINQHGATTVTLSHADTSSVADIGLGTNNFINGESYDTFGHVLSRSSGAVDFTVPDNYAFRNFGISTNSGFTFGAANANNIQAADSSSDTLTFVNGGAINIYGSTTAGTDAILIEHADTSSVGNLSSDNSGNTFIQDISFGFDTFGHVTSASVSTGTVPSPTLDSVTTAGFTTRGSSGSIANAGQETPGLEIYGAGSTNAAFMTFHRPGYYAIKLGLDTDNNLKIGGWSAGTNAWLIWHSGNLTNLNQLSNGPGYISSLSFDGLTSKSEGTGIYQTSGSFRAPIFIDSNNPAYYLDPSTTGTSLNCAGSLEVGGWVNATGIIYGSSLETNSVKSNSFTAKNGTSGITISGISTMNGSTPLNGVMYYSAALYLSSTLNQSVRINYFNDSDGNTTPTNRQLIVGDGNQNDIFHVKANGNVIAAGSIAAFSDLRVKTNISKIEHALNKVEQLNGYTFDRTDIEGPRQTGVIAQEVIKVLPEAVFGSEDTSYSVAYANMMGLMIEAIKELNAKVDDLQKQLVNK